MMNTAPLGDKSNKDSLTSKPQRTRRGKAVFLSSDDESDEAGSQQNVGIYGSMLKCTKQELKENKTKFAQEESKIIKEVNNDLNSVQSDLNDSNDSNIRDDNTSGSDEETGFNVKKSRVCDTKSRSPSPPPKPKTKPKNKRKSTAVEKHLKQWETFKTKTLTNHEDLLNVSVDPVLDESLVRDNSDMILIRVLTKNGIQRIETKKSDTFLTIYKKIANLEDILLEDLILLHNENRIEHSETPLSLNLLFSDIIECQYIKRKIRERIEIIDKEDDSENATVHPNMVEVILQTKEGRKSRVKLLIAKDEPLKNMLAKYCEHKDLGNPKEYMLEFDGDMVSETETSFDLDLDGGEIFDVKMCAKPTMQMINENKKNYEFDDEILIC